VGAAGSLLAWLAPANALDWQPALAATEPWRWITAAFVHWSPLHLAANLAGAAVLAAFGWAAALPARAALAWALAWPLTHGVLLLQPALAHYGGLSGVLHAGVAVGAAGLVLERTGRARTIGAAVMAGLLLKIVLERPWAGPLAHPPGWDIAVAPLAHAGGAAAGLLCAGLVRGVTSKCGAATWLEPPREAGRAQPGPGGAQNAALMTERRTTLDARAVMLVVACTAIWGVNQVATKVALAEIPPLLQAGIRSLGAAVLLALWAHARGLSVWRHDGTLGAGLLAGLFFAAEFACIFIGLQYTTASRMAVFIYLAPFVVALGMPLIAPAERLDRWQGLGLTAAFAGVVWAFAGGFSAPVAGPRQWLGDALGIAAALLWGMTTLVLRGSRLTTALPEKTLLYQLLVSGLALAAAAAAAGEAWPAVLTGASLWPLAFQTVVVSFASYLAWFWLLRHYPATRISVFVLLTPVFGLLAGVGLLGETLTPRLVVALLAVCAGIALVNRPPRSGTA
jgi:rhomboid family GlyGly-CTERM serine protease